MLDSFKQQKEHLFFFRAVEKIRHQRTRIISVTLLASISAPSKYTSFSDFQLLMVFPCGVTSCNGKRKDKGTQGQYVRGEESTVEMGNLRKTGKENLVHSPERKAVVKTFCDCLLTVHQTYLMSLRRVQTFDFNGQFNYLFDICSHLILFMQTSGIYYNYIKPFLKLIKNCASECLSTKCMHKYFIISIILLAQPCAHVAIHTIRNWVQLHWSPCEHIARHSPFPKAYLKY